MSRNNKCTCRDRLPRTHSAAVQCTKSQRQRNKPIMLCSSTVFPNDKNMEKISGGTPWDVRSHRFFVQLNPPFHDQNFSFTVHFVANPATYPSSQKNERDIRPKCKKKKKHENTTVLKKQKRTICVFKCWLNCQLAPFEALRSLEQPSTIQRHRGARSLFLRLVVFIASLQPKNDSPLSLMCILHAQAHQSFRTVDPQDDLIGRDMTKTPV